VHGERDLKSHFSSLLSKIQVLNSQSGLGFLNELKINAESLRSYLSLYTTRWSDETSPTGRRIWNDVSVTRRLFEVEADDYVTRMSELTELILGKGLDPWDRAQEFHKFLYLSMNGKLVSEFKLAVNMIFARYFGTDSPTLSGGELGINLLPRRLVHHLKAYVLSKRYTTHRKLENDIVINTIFQGLKKGLLPLRPDAVDASLLKHCEALTKSGICDEGILDGMEAIMEEEFRGLPKFLARFAKKTYPSDISSSACIGGTRADLGHILYSREEIDSERIVSSILGQSLQILLTHRRNLNSFGEELLYGQENDLELAARARLRTDNWLSKPRVMPCVILEPLKGRIITKPNPGEYLDMRGLQKGLWSYLQKYKTFCLTGRPVTKEDIAYIGASWDSGKKINSGDFSAATDNLKSEVSKMILSYALSQCKDQSLIYRALKSFCEAQIDYPETPIKEPMVGGKRKEVSFLSKYSANGWKATGLEAVQSNGQLMGHLLSFPILCLANYLIFKLVYKRMERQAPNCLINGDDILFAAYPDEYQNWWKLVTQVGFIPSMGKNLFSDKIAQVNSQLYRLDTSSVQKDGVTKYYVRRVTEIPYFSFGLLLDRGKGKESTQTVYRNDDIAEENRTGRLVAFWRIYGELLAPGIIPVGWGKKSKVDALFRRNNQATLDLFGRHRKDLDVTDRSHEMESKFDSLGGCKADPMLEAASIVSSFSRALKAQAESSVADCFQRFRSWKGRVKAYGTFDQYERAEAIKKASIVSESWKTGWFSESAVVATVSSYREVEMNRALSSFYSPVNNTTADPSTDGSVFPWE